MVVDYSKTVNIFIIFDALTLPLINDLVHTMAKYRVFSKLGLKCAYYQVPIKEAEKLYTAVEANGELINSAEYLSN